MNQYARIRDIYIVGMTSLPRDAIELYWQTLHMHGRLDARLCDVKDPTWEDVVDMIRRMGSTMFACVNKHAEIRGEFMLENFTGAAAQIHISGHPDLSGREAIDLGIFASDEILRCWDIKTLFGLTPVTNRVARLYNHKVGFRCIGILPNGMTDRGKIVDGHIMVKEA